jgi:cobalt-zinc-cadmium efflux system outer membrane protein
MNVKNPCLLSCAIVLWFSPVAAPAGEAADTSATLSAFIAQAVRANPGLQAVRVRSRSVGARVEQAGAWEDPQVGVEFFATPITSANPFKDGMETDYFIQQMIPLFGKKRLMADAATAGARVAEQTAEMAERSLEADVKKTYAMIFSAQRRIDVNIENQRLLSQLLESARGKYSVGFVTQGDVLKVQVELAKLQNERTDLEQNLVEATTMMNALRNAPMNTRIGRVEDVPLAKVTETLEGLLARALDERPELRGMRYELEMNNAELAASERERLPDLMIRGMYKQMVEGTDQWAAMFSINIPFAPWSSGKYSGKIEENELSARTTEFTLFDMKNMVQADVREKWSKAMSKWEQIERYRQAMLPQAEQALQASLSAYETNRTDFLSLIDSYRMTEMLNMDFYMLVEEYLTNAALLEKAVGGGVH